jgi:hypothetical protein
MSYELPASNAVNFTFQGEIAYSPPAYNAVDFGFSPGGVGICVAAGGSIEGGAAVAHFYRLLADWPASGGSLEGGAAPAQFYPAGFSGQAEKVIITVSGVPRPTVGLTLRQTDSLIALDVDLAGVQQVTAGAPIRVEMRYSGPAGNATYIRADGVVSGYAVRNNVTHLQATGVASVGVGEIQPGQISVVMSGRYRAPIDWRVRPGHTLNGATVRAVTATLSTGGQWFQEVSYG